MTYFKGVCSIESRVKYLSSGRSAVKKLVKTTIFKGLTFKSIPDIINVLLTTNKGLLYDNN